MKINFDGVNKIMFLIKEDGDDDNPVIEASWIYAKWKNWVISSPDNMKYSQAMRSIGGDPLSSTKYIAPYYEVMNNWNIKPYDGNYILTVQGNLFGTGGRFPFVGADNGTVLVSMETTGNALALQNHSDNIKDTIAPTWDGAIGITDAYQDGDGIHIRWGHATDNLSKEVKYNVYISEYESNIWDFKLGAFDGNMLVIYTEYDGITPLQPGKTYYIGVRAVDEAGNETTNTNYATINYTGSSVYDEILNKVDNIQSVVVDIQNMVNILMDVEIGNWEIKNNQMIFYDREGNVLYVYNLYDKFGRPTTKSVYKRERI
jgi:hypothetical protein